MSQAVLIERFLGAYESADGPFALLGLSPEDCTEPRIAAALERQLARISRHPQATTPEAEEVRLVLHVAAAQLRDTEVLRELSVRWRARRGQAAPPPIAPVVNRPPPQPSAPSSPPQTTGAAPPMIPQPRPSQPSLVPPISASQPLPPRAPAPVNETFRAIAAGVLKQSGGWNASSKKRLEALAGAYGVSTSELDSILWEVGTGPTAPPRDPSSDKPEKVVSPTRRLVLTIATVVLFVASAFMAVHVASRFELLRLIESEDEELAVPAANRPLQQAATDPAATVDGAPVDQPQTQQADATAAAPQAAVPPKELLARLRAAKAKITNDPRTSLNEFEACVAELSQQWGSMSPELLTGVHNEVVDFIFDASRRDRGTGRAALELILSRVQRLASGVRVSDSREIMASAWATGMLNRLRRDRDLPDNLGEAINSTLRKVASNGRLLIEQTNAQGAMLALEAMAERLLPHEEDDATGGALVQAWGGWIKATQALGKNENAVFARDVLMSSIDQLLIKGLDPSVSRSTNEVLKLLLAAADWTDGAGVGARAISWFDDVSQITTSDLAVVTNWLVGSSNLPGVNPEMMLAPDATPARRMELRDSYASLFGLPASREGRGNAARWATQAREMITPPSSPPEMDDALVRTAALARMNEAAAQRWRQNESASETAREAARIEAINATIRSGSTSTSVVNSAALTSPGDERDGLWARRYLASMNAIDSRVELLNELRNAGGPVGPADADVLAEAACFGSPMQIRRLAQSIVRELADNLLVVNGVLEALPRAARQQGIADAIEAITGTRLPKVEDSTWRLESRRALVSRMLELIATGKDTRFDALGDIVAGAYRARVDAFGPPTASMRDLPAGDADASAAASADAESNATPSSPGAEQPAGELWELWASQGRRYAEGGWTFVGLDVLQRRRAGRASLADDALQLFAAEQASGAEMMGYVVAAERPTKSDAIKKILDEMATERRTSAHLFAQMESAERAILRLWLVRFGEEEKS